jgi:hypothetical protein
VCDTLAKIETLCEFSVDVETIVVSRQARKIDHISFGYSTARGLILIADPQIVEVYPAILYCLRGHLSFRWILIEMIVVPPTEITLLTIRLGQ